MAKSDEKEYPQYFVFKNLWRGIEAYKRSQEDLKIKERFSLSSQLKKGKQAYKTLTQTIRDCKEMLSKVPEHLQDTAIPICFKHHISEIPRILQKASVLAR